MRTIELTRTLNGAAISEVGCLTTGSKKGRRKSRSEKFQEIEGGGKGERNDKETSLFSPCFS